MVGTSNGTHTHTLRRASIGFTFAHLVIVGFVQHFLNQDDIFFAILAHNIKSVISLDFFLGQQINDYIPEGGKK